MADWQNALNSVITEFKVMFQKDKNFAYLHCKW